MSTFDMDHVNYEDFIDCTNRFVKYFREEQKVDYVISLNHIWANNDRKLAEAVEGVDIFLGGHDHTTVDINVKDTLIKKSGTDFWEFTLITLQKRSEQLPEDYCFNKNTGVATQFIKVDITKEFEPDLELAEVVHTYSFELNKALDKLIGYVDSDLELRFSWIRSMETNFSNIIVDIINYLNKSDCMILNSGTLRADMLIPWGPIKNKEIQLIFPMIDPIVVLNVRGDGIHNLLENGVSSYPKLDGKFPIVSGIWFTFDAGRHPFSRINKEDISINGEPLDYDWYYKVSTKFFIS